MSKFEEWCVVRSGKPFVTVRVTIEEEFVPDMRLAATGRTVHEENAKKMGEAVTKYVKGLTVGEKI